MILRKLMNKQKTRNRGRKENRSRAAILKCDGGDYEQLERSAQQKSRVNQAQLFLSTQPGAHEDKVKQKLIAPSQASLSGRKNTGRLLRRRGRAEAESVTSETECKTPIKSLSVHRLISPNATWQESCSYMKHIQENSALIFNFTFLTQCYVSTFIPHDISQHIVVFYQHVGHDTRQVITVRLLSLNRQAVLNRLRETSRPPRF